MRWITRENIKVDRVACPWLIKRSSTLMPSSCLFRSKSFSMPRREKARRRSMRFSEVTLNHRGDRCTFEAILEDFKLRDEALQRLGSIVRAADVKGQEHVAADGAGLRAIAQGFAELGLSDNERLRVGFPVYDALYAYVSHRK